MRLNRLCGRFLVLRRPFLTLLIAAQCATVICDAKTIFRRDPRDGAIDASVIAILKQQSPGVFEVQEAFLGEVHPGEKLQLPGFSLVVEDESSIFAGVTRTEPIGADTRILVFLKPAKDDLERHVRYGDWVIAGLGNCYFYTQNPDDLTELHHFAASALALRHSWESARNIGDERKRVEALWPFLWDRDGSCFDATQAEFRKIGPVAGDYIAEQFDSLTYLQRSRLLRDIDIYRSAPLHRAVADDLANQERLWAQLLSRHGGAATYDRVSPPGRMRYSPPRAVDFDADRADDIYGEMYYGLSGLAKFEDRGDLQLIQETARWALKYRFKQVDDAAVDAFRRMPARENVPIIGAIWSEYSKRPYRGNELHSFDVMRALETHPYPETIPVMAQFVNAPFADDIARRFLVRITGVDLGGNQKAWLRWWAANRQDRLRYSSRSSSLIR